jgi:glycosyltransferase involved in cell wall biosynthesis
VLELNIVVAHASLNNKGGAEKVCLNVIEALKLAGYTVTLLTVDKTDWESLKKIFGNTWKPDQEYYLLRTRPLTMYLYATSLLIGYTLELLAFKLSNHFVINTYGDMIHTISDISYMGAPLRLVLKSSAAGTGKGNLYEHLYSAFNLMIDRFPRGTILTYSKYAKSLIQKHLHSDSIVLHPPVDLPSQFSEEDSRERENLVVTISRYRRGKQLLLLPIIANHVPTAKFTVIGTADKYSSEVLDELVALTKRLKLEGRITFLTNTPRESMFGILSKAKVYLHLTPYEPFGIAPIEAMALGCVPVVHRSGGLWSDVLGEEQGRYGFAYDNIQQASDYISTLMSDEERRKLIASNDMRRAKMFDKATFQRRMVSITRARENYLKSHRL